MSGVVFTGKKNKQKYPPSVHELLVQSPCRCVFSHPESNTWLCVVVSYSYLEEKGRRCCSSSGSTLSRCMKPKAKQPEVLSISLDFFSWNVLGYFYLAKQTNSHQINSNRTFAARAFFTSRWLCLAGVSRQVPVRNKKSVINALNEPQNDTDVASYTHKTLK